MFEEIGEERTCEKCDSTVAYEFRPSRFRCKKHLTRFMLGQLAANSAVLLGQTRLGPEEPITSGSQRSANLLRLMPLMSGKLELADSVADATAEWFKSATFNADGDLTGFGKSPATIRLVEETDASPQSDAPPLSATTAFRGFRSIIWESSTNRLRKLLGLSEQHASLLTWYQQMLELPADNFQFLACGRGLSAPEREDWWTGRPDVLHDARDQILRKYAPTVGIAEVTVDACSPEELVQLLRRHELSRWDLVAAGLFWAFVTDDAQRAARKRAWEQRCVSALMIRIGRDFFDQWQDEFGP